MIDFLFVIISFAVCLSVDVFVKRIEDAFRKLKESGEIVIHKIPD